VHVEFPQQSIVTGHASGTHRSWPYEIESEGCESDKASILVGNISAAGMAHIGSGGLEIDWHGESVTLAHSAALGVLHTMILLSGLARLRPLCCVVRDFLRRRPGVCGQADS
jgi:hypothetical protein